MKYNCYILLLFIVFILSFSIVRANNLELFGKLIYIDAGHGGVDPGAVYKDIHEKHINLSIAKRLRDELIKKGAIVYMTRYNDNDLSSIKASRRKQSDLSNRAKLINTSNADIYISIHLNSSNNTNYNGVQMFYDDVNEKNKLFAQSLQNEFNKNKKIKEIYNLYMYKNIKVPGVLAEVGYISNNNDRMLLLTNKHQKEISEKLVNGIKNYFKYKSLK